VVKKVSLLLLRNICRVIFAQLRWCPLCYYLSSIKTCCHNPRSSLARQTTFSPCFFSSHGFLHFRFGVILLFYTSCVLPRSPLTTLLSFTIFMFNLRVHPWTALASLFHVSFDNLSFLGRVAIHGRRDSNQGRPFSPTVILCRRFWSTVQKGWT